MKLVILHGPPASGKLTVANELAKAWGYQVMHNHLTIDLALSIFPEFGTPDFFNFVNSIRSISIGKACRNNISGLIITNCHAPNWSDDVKNVNEWTKIVIALGGTVLPIYLDVPLEILNQRASEPSRKGTHKPHTQEALASAMSYQQFGPINSPDTITISSGTLSVEETVAEIVQKASTAQAQH